MIRSFPQSLPSLAGFIFLFGQFSFAIPDRAAPITTTTPPPTSLLVVTGTGSDHPMATYEASLASTFKDIKTKTVTTDEKRQSITVYPGGWVWNPKSSTASNLPPIPDNGPAPTIPSATSQIVVTATTGNHPVVTFQPSKDPQYSSITETKTTTDKDHHTIVIFPFGWIWKPVGGGLPPILPQIPLNLPPPVIPKDPTPPKSDPPKSDPPKSDPPKSDPPKTDPTTKEDCKTSAPSECTKTVSFVSGPNGYATTTKGDCPKPTGCVSGTQVTKTTTIPTQLPYAAGSITDIDEIPPLEDPDQEVIKYFETLYFQQSISLSQGNPKPVCKTDKVNVNYVFFTALSKKFCDAVKADVSKTVSKDLDSTALAKRGHWKRTALKGRTPPAGPGEYKGFKFHFEWKPKKGDCFQDCGAAFGSIVNECGHFGGESNGMKLEGSLDVGCGDYTWKITEPDKPNGDQPSGTQPSSLKPNPANYGKCNRDIEASGPTYIPSVKNFPAPQLAANKEKFGRDKAIPAIDKFCNTPDLLKEYWRTGANAVSPDIGNGLNLFMAFNFDQDACGQPDKDVVNAGGYKWNEDCISGLQSALDLCDTGTTTEKMGGYTIYRCFDYIIGAGKGGLAPGVGALPDWVDRPVKAPGFKESGVAPPGTKPYP